MYSMVEVSVSFLLCTHDIAVACADLKMPTSYTMKH